MNTRAIREAALAAVALSVGLLATAALITAHLMERAAYELQDAGDELYERLRNK